MKNEKQDHSGLDIAWSIKAIFESSFDAEDNITKDYMIAELTLKDNYTVAELNVIENLCELEAYDVDISDLEAEGYVEGDYIIIFEAFLDTEISAVEADIVLKVGTRYWKNEEVGKHAMLVLDYTEEDKTRGNKVIRTGGKVTDIKPNKNKKD